jgi:thiol:disulfide interchange protein DsbD
MTFPLSKTLALGCSAVLLGPASGLAQDAEPGQADATAVADLSPHSKANLLAEVTAVRPGEPFWVGLHVALDSGWHTYWKNPGDSGMPAAIEWNLPEGYQAGDIRWPWPVRIEFPPLVSYGYFDEVMLLVEITPPTDLAPGDTVRLSGRADWLVCMEDCFPAEAPLRLDLPVSVSLDSPDDVIDSRSAQLLSTWRARLAARVPDWRATAGETDAGYFLTLLPVGPEAAHDITGEGVHFFPAGESVLDHASPQDLVQVEDGLGFTLALARSAFSSGAPDVLRGVLVAPDDRRWDEVGEVQALRVEAPLVTRMVTGRSPSQPLADGSSSSTGGGTGGVTDGGAVRGTLARPTLTLPLSILFAFLGGLILNLMPCVFPVLSLKVLGFVESAERGAGEVRRHGIVFGAGVLSSFWVLGGVLVVLRSAGEALGWGFQLQSPLFVGMMAALFLVLALMLLGLSQPGAGLGRLERAIGGRSSYPRSFGSGVLATLVATPCTAPFMGAALGYALLRPAAETMLVFTVLGLGMATPYMILAASPGILARLPRPGPWMGRLKRVLAVPLLGTVAWLAWVFTLQTGAVGLAGLTAGLCLAAAAMWVVGRWGSAVVERPTRQVARIAAAGMALAAVGLLVRASRLVPAGQSTHATPASAVADGSNLAATPTWRPFSAAEVASIAASGRPVFVDFTAAWCLSCQVNERVVLHTEQVRTAFRDAGVTLVRADWTRRDPAITQALAALGRSSVPVYALYPGGEVPPILLPSVLTRDLVIRALATHVISDSRNAPQGG